MSTLVGLLAAVMSGILNGSFAVPMKLCGKWEWENIWLLYAVSALLVFPAMIAAATVPGLLDVYRDAPGGVLIGTLLYGAGWGIGSLMFGLGLHMVGLSLGYTIIMGLIAVTGSLLPMLIRSPGSLLSGYGTVVLLAMVVTVGGVALCGSAGLIREKASRENREAGRKRYPFKWALVVCVASGALSAMLNLAFDQGAPIAETAKAHLGPAATAFRANNAIWLVALSGGFVPFLAYCGYLLVRKGSWRCYGRSGAGSHWFFSVLMGAIWIGCIMLYGAGASNLGRLGTTIGWLILMAVTVLTGNIWGVATGEWKTAPAKARLRMAQGVLLLIGSVALVSVGKALWD